MVARAQPSKLGILGGTFDPIHIGHLIAASEALDRFGLDLVLFVPAGQPWQKRKVTSAEHRFVMTTLAVSPHPSFAVSRMELDRRGPTYTADTLQALRELYAEAEFFFIAGVDALARLDTWHDVERVKELARLIAADRPLSKGSQDLPDGVEMLEMPLIGVSATDIRRRVKDERPIEFLVPDPVATYIRQHGLYAGDSDA